MPQDDQGRPGRPEECSPQHQGTERALATRTPGDRPRRGGRDATRCPRPPRTVPRPRTARAGAPRRAGRNGDGDRHHGQTHWPSASTTSGTSTASTNRYCTVTAGDGRSAAFVERPTALGARRRRAGAQPNAAPARSRVRDRPRLRRRLGLDSAADRYDRSRNPRRYRGADPVRALRGGAAHRLQPGDRQFGAVHGAAGRRGSDEVLAALEGCSMGTSTGSSASRSEPRTSTPAHETTAREQVARCGGRSTNPRGHRAAADPDQPDILRAFRLANAAMADQRARGEWVKDGQAGPPDPAAGRWRPFQIAFVLLCLAGIDDPGTRDRGSPTCCGSPPVVARQRPTSD